MDDKVSLFNRSLARSSVLRLLAAAFTLTFFTEPVIAATVVSVCSIDGVEFPSSTSYDALGWSGGSACSGTVHLPEDRSAYVSAHAGVSGGTNSFDVSASAFGYTNAPDWAAPSLGASAYAELSVMLYTPGPLRNGLIRYRVNAGREGAAFAKVEFMGSCESTPECRFQSNFEPFMLGVPFEVQLSAYAGGGDAGASLELEVYKLPRGCPVWDGSNYLCDTSELITVLVSREPINSIPEPSSLGPTGLGLIAAAMALRSRMPVRSKLGG